MDCEITLKSGQVLALDDVIGCAYKFDDDRLEVYYSDGVVDGYPYSEIEVISFYA